MRAARDRPSVNALTWRMAASGSAKPMDSNRSRVAWSDRVIWSSSMRALIGSIGR